ncbi:hypothetical protein Ddye_017071 [Dipteronia dyeriana]|uniref:Cupin type-1 domain-containing protein n=1 Tax=Dipteronia dyeriana TaxID=168575 RepID=A0AAD9U810_9ROSI|nr:hypothetical protein Ddye_017071 [Dipteronia dyeriana]
MAKQMLLLSLTVLTISSLAIAYEPSPLQDFCVADSMSSVAMAAFNSQNPGLIGISSAVFGSNPPIASDVLAKAFQVDKEIVEQIQLKF